MLRLLFLCALSLTACADVVRYDSKLPPTASDPKAIMSAGTCNELPFNGNPNVNAGAGWAKDKAPTPMEQISCASKYASGVFYCADPAKCTTEFTYGVTFSEDMRGKPVHMIVDLIGGSIQACAQPAFRWGVRSGIDCKKQTITATKDHSVRGVFETTVPVASATGEQTAPQVQVVLIPAPGSGPITIGQIGSAEPPRP